MKSTPLFSLPPLPGLPLLQNLLASVQPPDWVVDEVQNRIVLLLNHVLTQEPEAQERVRRQQGKVARLVWGQFEMTLKATPAGLLERPMTMGAAGSLTPDLVVRLADTALPDLLVAVSQGEKPAVTIEGDVQLAAEVAWLVDHLRWDIEDDVARILGDVPAHTLIKAVKTGGDALRSFAVRWKPQSSSDTSSVS
jgi:ubiquinone biosynthesis protein UbiJ